MTRFIRALAAAALAVIAGGMMATASDFNAPALDNSHGTAIQPWVVAPGDTITVTGSHFSSDASAGNCQLDGAPTIHFRPLDGSPEQTVKPATDAANCTDSMARVQVPGNLGGAAKIYLTDYRGQATNTSNTGFVPVITFKPSAGLSQASGTVATGAISVNGGGLHPLSIIDSSKSLTFGGAARGTGGWSDTSISFTPGNASGAVHGQFSVFTDANNISANLQTVTFDAGTYTFLPPTVQGGTVAGQTVGSTFTIPGANLGTAKGTVAFAGGVSRAATSWSNDGLTVQVPAGAQPGAVSVSVPTYGSVAGPAVQLNPLVQAITPTAGSAGATVKVTGYNFGGLGQREHRRRGPAGLNVGRHAGHLRAER